MRRVPHRGVSRRIPSSPCTARLRETTSLRRVPRHAPHADPKPWARSRRSSPRRRPGVARPVARRGITDDKQPSRFPGDSRNRTLTRASPVAQTAALPPEQKSLHAIVRIEGFLRGRRPARQVLSRSSSPAADSAPRSSRSHSDRSDDAGDRAKARPSVIEETPKT